MGWWARLIRRHNRAQPAIVSRWQGQRPDATGFAPLATNSAPGSVPTAWACVNVLTDALVRCRIYITRPRHPLAPLFADPSPDYDAAQAWSLIISAAVARGNGYAVVSRRPDGSPRAITPCYAVPGASPSGALQYSVTPLTSRTSPRGVFAAADVIALHGPGFDGMVSPSPLAYAARDAIAVMSAANLHNRTSLTKGMSGRNVLTTDPQLATLTAAQRREIEQAIMESYAGAINADRIPVLPAGISPASMGGISAVDMQLVELMRWTVEDICRVFAVPPRMVGHQTSGMRVETKLGQQGEDFFRWSLAPWIHRIEAQLTTKLLSIRDRAAGVRVRLSADAISQGTFEERVNAIDQAVAKAGVLTINEGRAVLGYAPRADGDHLIQPAGTPAGSSGE